MEADRALEEKTLALEERKMQLVHEVSMRELELKSRQASETSSNDGSISSDSSGEKRMHISKDLVPSFVVGDDVVNWFQAYEVAFAMHRMPGEDWGVRL